MIADFSQLDPMVAVHIVFALFALILGPVALFRRRRDRWHRWFGRAWVVAMAGTSLSSFAITGLSGVITVFGINPLGPFSPIHLLSVYLLWGLWNGVAAIRRGNVILHKRLMVGLYTQALLIASVLTLWPGRTISRMLAPDAPWLGLGVAMLVALLLGLVVDRAGRRTVPQS